MTRKQQSIVKKQTEANSLIRLGAGATLMIGATMVRWFFFALKECYAVPDDKPAAATTKHRKKSRKTSSKAKERPASTNQTEEQKMPAREPFLWEPRLKHSSQSTITVKQENTPISIMARQQQEHIDFLAGMTFANVGMRAPSCPCCQ
jgi:hypothetical protein